MSIIFPNKTRNGYSILELLVVVSILIIIFTLGQANYRSFQQRQRLESAVRMFKSDLALAKEMALSGRKPSGCTNLKAYVIDNTGPKFYNLRALCDSDSCNNAVLVEKKVDLSSDGNIRFQGSNFCVQFLPLGLGVRNATTVAIRDIITNFSTTVSISVNGVVN